MKKIFNMPKKTIGLLALILALSVSVSAGWIIYNQQTAQVIIESEEDLINFAWDYVEPVTLDTTSQDRGRTFTMTIDNSLNGDLNLMVFAEELVTDVELDGCDYEEGDITISCLYKDWELTETEIADCNAEVFLTGGETTEKIAVTIFAKKRACPSIVDLNLEVTDGTEIVV